MSTTKVEVHGYRVFLPGIQKGFDTVSGSQAAYLASMFRDSLNAAYIEGRNDNPRWKCGWLRNKNSMWLGVHYSPHNQRWCINLIPCFTLWITKPGGNTP